MGCTECVLMKAIAIKLILAGLLVLAPLKPMLIAAMVLSFVDLLSGLAAAKHRKDEITSSGLKRTIMKVLVYEVVIILGFLTERYLIGDALPLTSLITSYIGITELKSVLENIQEVSGVDVLKSLIDKLSDRND